MEKEKVIEPIGFIVAITSFIFSFLIYFYYSFELLGSLFAAFLTAAIVWATYIVLRWVYLAIRE